MSQPTISFEFFPPQSLEASFRLWDTVSTLAHLDPAFVSVTYGAGGTTRKLTHEAVETLGTHMGLDVAAHLTCVDASREETREIAKSYAKSGVKRIVALRGDPPKGAQSFSAHPDGFTDAPELVAALAETGQFEITVGAYPDRHPEAAHANDDIDWLKRKIDAGATNAITQFFFEAETFLRFRDACTKAGITAEIIPGILPIENWSGTRRFAKRCGARIPPTFSAMFETAERDGRSDLLSTAICTELCTDLLEEGANHLHFYTLNKPGLTRDVVHALGLAPDTTLEKVA
ncbi:MAG: methylenetetrahydrofolate reductase [NAD(P)H] [Boseongicola sp.]|nr:methylenetetrahydrofolate reductase [NAD(P)H] [Boseongicola sp.]